MSNQTSAPRDGIAIAHGYGLKLYVQRGHLIIHDGVGRSRETRRYSRATSKLKRVVVIGHTGYITLEALRWIRDIGAIFVQIGQDGELVALSAPARHHEPRLRRAQVMASETLAGKQAVIQLVQAKLEGQAQVAERLAHLKPTVRIKDVTPVPVSEFIRRQGRALHPELSFKDLRLAEAIAGRAYWQVWARVPMTFDSSWRGSQPDHWGTAGPRTSYLDRKRARLAQTPAHAILNYLYAILETEAVIAAHTLGLDPAIGVMHADVRYRHSLATDLMEPGRPAADAIALDLLEERSLSRRDVHETRRGVCRVGAQLATELGRHGPTLRRAVASNAEQLTRTLLRASNHATPLTRRNHRVAVGTPPG